MKLIFAVLGVTQRCTLNVVIKRYFFSFIFAVFQPQYIAEILYFTFVLMTNSRHIEILLPVSILSFASSSACDSASTYQILSELDDQRRSRHYVDFARWRPYRRKSTFAYRFCDVSYFRKVKTICIPNFDQTS